MEEAYEWDAEGNAGALILDSEFFVTVLQAGVEKCPDEVCKAVAYTGNADITGIGVSLILFPPSSYATRSFIIPT